MFTGMDNFPCAPPVLPQTLPHRRTGWTASSRFASSGLVAFIAACAAWPPLPFLFVLFLGSNWSGGSSRALWRTLLQADLTVFPVAAVLAVAAISRNNRPGFAVTALILSAVPTFLCVAVWGAA